ncbi:MAG: GreA/GreB family elongation factor [Sphingomonadales bacterium]
MREIYPPITLTETDFNYLGNVLAIRSGALNEVFSFLEHELDRAIVVSDDRLPSQTVSIGRTVTYRDLNVGRERTVVLATPEQSDMECNRISVLSPIGAALIGLSDGQVIAWETWANVERMILVKKVHSHRDC